jgi:hypothetical protein
MNHFVKFLISLSVLTILSIAAAKGAFMYLGAPVPVGFYLPFLFFFLINTVVYKAVAGLKSRRTFPAVFMGGTALKLFGSLIFLVIYGYKFNEHVRPFFILFIFTYMVYTFFEVVSIIGYLKRPNKPADQ